MTDFAQFVAVNDDTLTLPDPHTGDIDISFQDIALADIDRSRTAIVMFKVGGDGFARLRMRFNSGTEHVIDFTSTPAAPRTWHEIFPGQDLRSANNELVILVDQVGGAAGAFGGAGRVRLSDIVILYHASAN